MAAAATSSRSLVVDSAKATQPVLRLEAFAISHAREVHGEAFPLGIRPTSDSEEQSIESTLSHIQSLADEGVLKDLLRKRRCHGIVEMSVAKVLSLT